MIKKHQVPKQAWRRVLLDERASRDKCQMTRAGLKVSGFDGQISCFGFGASNLEILFAFVSNFDIRIADFVSAVFWRDKISWSSSVKDSVGKNL
jgi:hypothetical protein